MKWAKAVTVITVVLGCAGPVIAEQKYVLYTVAVRTQPLDDAATVTYLKVNDKVEVLSTSSNGWSRVKTGKIVGYLSSSLLSSKKINLDKPKLDKPKPAGPSAEEAILLGIAQGLAQASPSQATTESKLMLFGGDGHRTYLGCLNCSKYDSDSIFNAYGKGSRYASESIFNRYSEFGSAYSQNSVCNPYAQDAPVIVDSNGRYYGRLTVNKYHSNIGIGSQWMGFVAAICQR